MSTRAIYTFYDSRTEVHVYKHHDGYPYAGGVHNGEAYEGGGLVWIKDAKGFAYKITSGGEDVRVTVLSVDWSHTFPMAADHRIEMEGPLNELLATQRANQ